MFDRDKVKETLKKTSGNVSHAARLLKAKRTTLRDYIYQDKELLKYCVSLRKVADKPAKVVQVPLELAKPDSNLKIEKKEKHRFVITCAQNNTDIHKEFIRSLKTYCTVNNAQLIVIPIRYKNVTAYVSGEDYQPYWPQELNEYYLNDELHLNDNLVILGDLKIQATAMQPLEGISALARNKSAIIGHPQVALKMIPTPLDELPRQLLTTGSCSIKNYSVSKAGQRAAFHHTIGAVVVEVDGDTFWTRQLTADEETGAFYDLDGLYSGNVYHYGYRVSGLVCGDIHEKFLDENVVKATWTGPKSIAKVCRPKHQFFHDALDFYSANHHHRNNLYTNFAKHVSSSNSVESEIRSLANRHNLIWSDEDTYYHYISSNHNDALTRWLMEADPKADPENALFYYRLQVYMLENTRMTESGTKIPNPLEKVMRQFIKNNEFTYFHSRDERVNLHGIDLSQHGDRGPNGKKGTINQFSQTGYKAVIGHSHTPGIEKGAYQVGTSSKLKLEYNSGYSSWLHTHCLIYPNGTRTLINIINGKWRLE